MFGISARVVNLERVQSMLASLPVGVKGRALEAINQYLLPYLKTPPAYKYVSRAEAYGKTFKSDAQRGWFWANGGPDMIGNHRTGEVENAWQTTKGDGTRQSLYNQHPASRWLYGKTQARQPGLVGWLQAMVIVAQNMAGAMNAAREAVQEFLDSRRT